MILLGELSDVASIWYQNWNGGQTQQANIPSHFEEIGHMCAAHKAAGLGMTQDWFVTFQHEGCMHSDVQ